MNEHENLERNLCLDLSDWFGGSYFVDRKLSIAVFVVEDYFVVIPLAELQRLHDVTG